MVSLTTQEQTLVSYIGPAKRFLTPFLTYLAGPYSSPNGLVKAKRADQLTLAASMLATRKGWNVFSPITHSHAMHLWGMAGDWNFWENIDTQYLTASERIVIVTLDGWEQSIGVNAEMKIAEDLGMPIWHLTAPELVNGKWTAWLTDNHTGEYLTYDIPVK